MSTSDEDVRDVRRSLEAATLALTTMTAMMDRLSALVVEWNARTRLPGSRTADLWLVAANELQAAITGAHGDVRRGYDG